MKNESNGVYRNEVEKPSMPSYGTLEKGEGCASFKNQADPIAMGQASGEGYRKDEGRISSQFKDYHWD